MNQETKEFIDNISKYISTHTTKRAAKKCALLSVRQTISALEDAQSVVFNVEFDNYEYINDIILEWKEIEKDILNLLDYERR